MGFRLLIGLCVSFTFMVLVYLTMGFYFGSYEDYFAAIVHGDLADPPYDLWRHDIHFLIFPYLARVAAWLPYVPVYGLWLALLNFIWLACMVWLWLIVFEERLRAQRWQVVVPFTVFSILLLFFSGFNSIRSFHSDRISILLTGMAVLLLFYDKKAGKVEYVVYFLVFMLGALTRIHTSFATLGMLLIFFVVEGSAVKSIARKFAPHVVLLGIFLGIYHYYGFTSHAAKLVETVYDYAIVDQQSLRPLSDMKTGADSAKYMAVTEYMISDSANLTPQFLARVVDLSIHSTSWLNPFQFLDQLPTFSYFFYKYWRGFALLFIILIIAARLDGRKDFWIRAMVMLVLFGLLIIYTTTAFNMFDRIFSPLRSVLIISILLYCLPVIIASPRAPRYFISFSLIALVFIAMKMPSRLEKNRQNQNREKYFESVILEIGRLQKIRTIMVVPASPPLTLNPFRREFHDIYAKMVFPDLDYLIYRNFAQARMIRDHGFSPLNFEEFYQFLMRENEHLMILTSDKRVQLYEYYFKEVYGYRLKMEEVDYGSPLWSDKVYTVCR